MLNSAALLFIADIDDQIPQLLHIPSHDVLLKYTTSAITPALVSFVRHRRAKLEEPYSAPMPRSLCFGGVRLEVHVEDSATLHDVLIAGSVVSEALPREFKSVVSDRDIMFVDGGSRTAHRPAP